MQDKQLKSRGSFTSSIGFIMAAAGSAVGLGNLWKFPYVAGKYGGGIFIIFYIIFVLILGKFILTSEMALGRSTRQSVVNAYKSINPKWKFVGVISFVCVFVILSYYSVVGGWILKYMFAYGTGTQFGDTAQFFEDFISQPLEPVIWHILFMSLTALIIILGVSKGIEKISKVLLPVLFIILIGIAVYAVTLPDAAEGLKFLFIPDFSVFSTPSGIFNSLIVAIGQVFFSLSLGLGITITYGSYMKKQTNIPKSSNIVAFMDTFMALLASIAILPAVFSFKMDPTAGPGLIFATLPSIFNQIMFGGVLGFLFFFLVLIAALTSSIALLEVGTAVLIDNCKMSRKKATILLGSIIAVIGILVSMSMGVFSDFKISGMNLFDAMGFLTDKVLLPISCICMCLFVGHVWGVKNAIEEAEYGNVKMYGKKLFGITIKYIAPILIGIIFVTGFIV